MSNKKNIKTIDCSKSCRMTATVRDSEYCTKEARVVGDTIFYGCKELLREQPKELRQFYVCDLWDVGLKDSCNTCKLACVNNKNEKIKETLKKEKELEKLIKDLTPHMVLRGVTPQEVKRISSTYTKKDADGKASQLGGEAIRAAKFANEALGLAVSGKRIDLAFYSIYARKANARIKKLKNKKKKKD